MARIFTAEKDTNSTPIYALGLPTATRVLFLTGITLEGTIPPVAGTDIVLFSGTTNFWVSYESFTLPTVEGAAAVHVPGEMNPVLRLFNEGTTFYVRTFATGYVTAAFWTRGTGEVTPYQNFT